MFHYYRLLKYSYHEHLYNQLYQFLEKHLPMQIAVFPGARLADYMCPFKMSPGNSKLILFQSCPIYSKLLLEVWLQPGRLNSVEFHIVCFSYIIEQT